MALPTTPDGIWKEIEKWNFAVLGFTNGDTEARAAGVVYAVIDRSLYVATSPGSWKARHIRANPNVSVTVPVQRLWIRIRKMPPAVITFSGHATVIPADEADPAVVATLLRGLEGDLSDQCIIRVDPVGRFVTYGIGVSLMTMRKPAESVARVPVG